MLTWHLGEAPNRWKVHTEAGGRWYSVESLSGAKCSLVQDAFLPNLVLDHTTRLQITSSSVSGSSRWLCILLLKLFARQDSLGGMPCLYYRVMPCLICLICMYMLESVVSIFLHVPLCTCELFFVCRVHWNYFCFLNYRF